MRQPASGLVLSFFKFRFPVQELSAVKLALSIQPMKLSFSNWNHFKQAVESKLSSRPLKHKQLVNLIGTARTGMTKALWLFRSPNPPIPGSPDLQITQLPTYQIPQSSPLPCHKH